MHNRADLSGGGARPAAYPLLRGVTVPVVVGAEDTAASFADLALSTPTAGEYTLTFTGPGLEADTADLTAAATEQKIAWIREAAGCSGSCSWQPTRR